MSFDDELLHTEHCDRVSLYGISGETLTTQQQADSRNCTSQRKNKRKEEEINGEEKRKCSIYISTISKRLLKSRNGKHVIELYFN